MQRNIEHKFHRDVSMSTDYSAVTGFGIDLGTTRPEAVFGPGNSAPGWDDDVDGQQAVVKVGHINQAYSSKHAHYFLCVPGSVRHVNLGASGTVGHFIEQAKIDAFVKWCRNNEVSDEQPQWMVACYSW
jgi:hypothetical protein